MLKHLATGAGPRSAAFQRTTMLLWVTCAIVLTRLPAQAQTFTVIHNFSGTDGANPIAGVSIDGSGRLYGATAHGGVLSGCQQQGCGVVYRLAREGSGWILTPLYRFTASDGAIPIARPVIGPGGLLYGTTNQGGPVSGCSGTGCGTLYALGPRPNACADVLCYWLQRKFIPFAGGSFVCVPFDLAPIAPAQRAPTQVTQSCPQYGDLTFDHVGNAYGTTADDGVYQLTPDGTLNNVYVFSNGFDGGTPLSGVVFDSAGNMYGTTLAGGEYSDGVVYEVSPSASGWTEQVLYNFLCGSDSGCGLIGGLVMDVAGNLYGATAYSGSGNGGTIFELSPSGGTWSFKVLYSFSDSNLSPQGPSSTLVMDASGNLYGTTTNEGAFGYGSVFKLTRFHGNWTMTSLHDFSGIDGLNPYGILAFDASGNLYGTAAYGGMTGNGVVWEITL